MAKKTITRPRKSRGKKNNSKKWRYIGIGVASLLVLLLAAGLWRVSRHLTHPKVVVSRAEFPIQGIDVSSHNGKIDFTKVAANGISFVYAKASEGTKFRDPKFSYNITEARKAGLIVGAYHFFRKDKPGKEQARNFIDAIGKEQLNMPLVIDVEDWGNSRFSEHDEVIRNLSDMIQSLQADNYKLMIYTNKDGYRKYLHGHFPHLPLWLCAFTHPNKLKKSYSYVIHQFSHWGSVDGIEGEVDLNVFCGDSTAWAKWLNE
ncbi:MAG: glycoside hydrolase family 25 protein [Muribaculaceae bacterium]